MGGPRIKRGVAVLLALAWCAAGPAHAAGDAVHGKSLFQARCSLCHAAGPDDGEGGMGPPLAGVVGRKAATAPGFTYSAALKGSGLTWTTANLDRFLKAPKTLVPGTQMPVATPSDKDRADLIAYLATLKR